MPLSNFVSDVEQRQVAAGANEGALALLAVERAGVGPLGLLAQDVELLLGQHLAPLVRGLDDAVGGGGRMCLRQGGKRSGKRREL